MTEFLAISKALSDESRVRAVLALAGGELCLCHLIELVGLSPSTVSKHMSVLQQAGLVRLRKDGRWHYYGLSGSDAPPMVRQALRWVLESLDGEPAVVADAEVLSGLRAKAREELTACYAAS
ncbi:MAG TPA: metalloregulator ArsR/SmtB family transcription factor [Thermoanaerobaculia bacterium]|nr:metalloregulator ArsR/SmtB family transcription factor [Thermoanaerobaculia bacterium]